MIEWINSISPQWFDFMLLFTIQNAVFISVVLAALYFLRNQSPKLLKMIALAGLIKLFIPPLPAVKEIVPPMYSAIPIIKWTNIEFFPIKPMNVSGVPLLSIYSIIMSLWFVIMLMLLIYTLVNIFHTAGTISRAVKIDSPSVVISENSKKIIVLRSKEIHSPYVIGLLRYFIIVPQSWDKWDEKIRRSVIVHETAHIKEGDQWVNLLKFAALLFHFFNPLVWILINRLNYLSEVICDDHSIINNRIPAHEYSKHLLSIMQDGRSSEFYKYQLSFSRAHKMIKNRMNYQLKRKDGDVLQRISMKSKLTIAVAMLTLLFVSLQCTQSDTPTKSEEPETRPLIEPAFEDGIYAFYAVDKKPRMLNKAIPEYPQEARENGIQGQVVLSVTIDENGHVINAEVFKPRPRIDKNGNVISGQSYTPPQELIPPAIEAAKKCLFEPAVKDGKKVKVRMAIPYAFRLQ